MDPIAEAQAQALDTMLKAAFPEPTWISVHCCICGEHIRTIEGHGVSGISHGVCPDNPECRRKMLEG